MRARGVALVGGLQGCGSIVESLIGAPVFHSQPTHQRVAYRGNAVFAVQVSFGEPLTFQWYKDGLPLTEGGRFSGTATSALTIERAEHLDAGEYAVVLKNQHGSVTSQIAVLTVEDPALVTLGDYFPLPPHAEWVYRGLDRYGQPAGRVDRVDVPSTIIVLHTGRSPVSSYEASCVRLIRAYVDPVLGVPYESWHDFLMIENGLFGRFGENHGGDGLRLDGGLLVPQQAVVGTTLTSNADAYLNGSFVAPATMAVEIIARTSIAVPAGLFADALHLRFGLTDHQGVRVYEEWWARSVGPVKIQGVSGVGSAEALELIDYAVPLPPSLHIRLAGSTPMLGVEAKLNTPFVLEYRTNLAAGVWQALSTLTLTNSPVWLTNVSAASSSQRFYRLRQVP